MLFRSEICNKGPEWKEIADQIIIFKPELSETGYYKSTKDIQEIIDQITETKSASPELVLIPPKADY